jgi:hypothetical protein
VGVQAQGERRARQDRQGPRGQRSGQNNENAKEGGLLDEQDRIDAAVELGVVGDLGKLSPDDLSAGGDETELRDVDLDDRTLGHDAQLLRGGKGVSVDRSEEGGITTDLAGENGPCTSATAGSS